MKNFKKLMALVIAAVMVVASMNVTAFADDPAYDGEISVTGTVTGDTLNFYKVVEWVDNAEGNVKGWKATADYASVLTEDALKAILGITADGTQDLSTATNITPAIARQLAVIARGKDAIQSGTDTTLDTTADGKGPGIYMVLINPADPDTIYNPVFVSSDYSTGAGKEGTIAVSATYEDATVKKSTTTLEKTAMTSEDAWDALEDGKAQWKTTAIGDTVTFTVVTTLPGYGDTYTNPHFAVKDKLTDLTLVANSVEVTAPAAAVGQYTVEEGTDNYTLTFKPEYLKTNKTPTQVTITYKAIVATDAPLHVNTEKNEVSTEFSHTPTSEDDYSFKKDTTQHYTFTIDANTLGGDSHQSGKRTSELIKIGQNPDGTPITEIRTSSEIMDRVYNTSPLAGAKFKLYTDADCTKEYIPKTKTGAPGTALTIESQADGRITGIVGLDAGTYYLQESEAPAGYVKDSNKVKIEITATTAPASVTEYTTDGVTWKTQAEYDALDASAKAAYKSYTYQTDVLQSYTVKVNDTNTNTYTFTNKGNDAEIVWTQENKPGVENPFNFVNTKGVELPSTGGMGTTLFYAIGAILVLGAGILLVSKRRMSAN